MARARADTGGFAKEPHSVSLKVLRLSRPSLAQQHPLPRGLDDKIAHTSSLAYPSSDVDQDFILSGNLSLPPSFGAAHVGEIFSCALCANSELLPETSSRSVSGIKILVEMQTPTQSISLEPLAADASLLPPSNQASALQRMIRFDLKEEGNHVLAINVTYTETLTGEGRATGGRVRSFRKLYQFVAQPCLNVRTKASELAPAQVVDKSHGPYGTATLLRYALEAQLENVSDTTIVLEESRLQSQLPFASTSLNWDAANEKDGDAEHPKLGPRDVLQLAFLVEQQPGVSEGLEDLKTSLRRDGRAVLGQLVIQWRGMLGEKGSLSTGDLMTRRKSP